MNKKTMAILVALLITGSVGLGIGFGNLYNRSYKEQKPAINIAEKQTVIQADTQVVFEQTYLKCQHTIISAFPERNQLTGKSLTELQETYNAASGYQVSWNSNTLLISQVIDDWCPKDKGKLRLKEYQNRVAIFQGPDMKNDALLKVTAISLLSLPPEVRKEIQAGTMEFYTQEELNDALENLDEYL